MHHSDGVLSGKVRSGQVRSGQALSGQVRSGLGDIHVDRKRLGIGREGGNEAD